MLPVMSQSRFRNSVFSLSSLLARPEGCYSTSLHDAVLALLILGSKDRLETLVHSSDVYKSCSGYSD